MYRNMNELIEDVLGDITIDRKFIRRLDDYVRHWQYKKTGNIDHSEFLGSNLIGVDKIVFSDSDEERYFKDILYTSSDRMNDAFRRVDGINTEFQVASNPFYLTNVTLMHMAYRNGRISNSERRDVLEKLGLVVGYKMFSSMYNYFFKYGTSADVSKATYERLNGKYLLKKHGTWNDVFIHRTEDVLPKGIFEGKLKSFSPKDAMEVVTGLHTRYKDMLKNLYREVLTTLERNERISMDGKIVLGTEDNSDSFRDVLTEQSRYVQYLKSIINSETDIINDNYIYLVCHLVPRCTQDQLENLLIGVSSVQYPTDPKDDYIEKLLISSFTYLTTKGITANYSKQIQKCMIYLKNYWSAGNIKDHQANDAKKLAIAITSSIVDPSLKNLISSIAIGFILYLFCLAIANAKE